MRRWTVFVMTVTVSMAACGGGDDGVAVRDDPDTALIERFDIPVGDLTTMDAYAPPGAGDLPVAVLLHGTLGDRTRMTPLARSLAARGTVVFVPSWPVVERPEAASRADPEPFRAQTEAVVCALRRADVLAAELGGVPGSSTLIGYSGGGMVGATASLVTDPTWSGFECDAGVAHAPARFIGISGDYGNHYQFGEARADGFAPFDPYQIDIDNRDLEVVLINGSHDENIPPAEGTEFAAHLADAGLDLDAVLVESGHATLIEPETPSGTRIVDLVVGAMQPDAPATPVSGTATMRFDGTCRFDGPTTTTVGELLDIEVRNVTDEAVWFGWVVLAEGASVPDLEPGVVGGTAFTPPTWVGHAVLATDVWGGRAGLGADVSADSVGRITYLSAMPDTTELPICVIPMDADERPGAVFSAVRPDGTLAVLDAG